MAKKSNLMRVVEHDLIEHLRSGLTIRDACALVGITEKTYHEWCNRFSDFGDAAMRARVQTRQLAVLIVRKAVSEGDVSAAEWYLERTDPERWGKRTYHRIERLDELLKAIEKAGLSYGDVFNAMIAELASVDSAGDSEAGS